MKKILIFIFWGSCILLFTTTGCKKNPLDITPDGRISLDSVFADQTKTEAFLNTLYNPIPPYLVYYPTLVFLAALSDEAVDATVGFANDYLPQTWASGSLTVENNPLGFLDYSRWWSSIQLCNIFLERIDEANIKDPMVKDRYKGEAQILRAFFYWELVKQYGPMPALHNSLPFDFEFTTLKRGDFQTSVDSIVADCDAAIANQNLPDRISKGAEKGRMTRAIAYAIKSQSLLYNASPLWNPENNLDKYRAAASAAKEALTALASDGTYKLYPLYEPYFTNRIGNTSDEETIYEAPADGSYLSFVNMIPSLQAYGYGIRAGSCPTQGLIDSYEMQTTGEPPILGYLDEDHLQPIINPASGYNEAAPYENRDPRFYASIWYNGAAFGYIAGRKHTVETFVGGKDHIRESLTSDWMYSLTGYYLRKFVDPQLIPGEYTDSRAKKYRLAELYLNFAEAENEVNGPTAEVHAAVNMIRSRVQMPNLPKNLTKEEMRNRIRNERRVELAFEEHRFWDVRRWKILSQTDRVLTGMKITKNPNGTFNYERIIAQERDKGWQEKYLIFPIPLRETSNIPDFGEFQNPGW